MATQITDIGLQLLQPDDTKISAIGLQELPDDNTRIYYLGVECLDELAFMAMRSTYYFENL